MTGHMKSRARLDVAVAGGGVVGAACALALARAGLDVALVEARPVPRWLAEQPDLRVYALAPDNAALLDALGVWPQVVRARAQPYRKMRVWDAGGGDELAFDAAALARSELGWIVENGLLVDRLWAALVAAGVRVHCPARVQALEQDAAGVRLQLDDGTRLEARVAVAADGGASELRRLAGLDVDAMPALADIVRAQQKARAEGGPVLFKSCGWAGWDLAAARLAVQARAGG